MLMTEDVRAQAAALREKYGTEVMTCTQVAETLGISRNTLSRRKLAGWIGSGSGKRMPVETLARYMVGR